jgi:hypothetical protein
MMHLLATHLVREARARRQSNPRRRSGVHGIGCLSVQFWPCLKIFVALTIRSRTRLPILKFAEERSGNETGAYQPRTWAKISGATMVASDSMMKLGVSTPSLPQVIFSLGTAPE